MKAFLRILLIVFIFNPFALKSQTNCSCEDALKKLILKIETEYPGFQEKVNDSLQYNSHKTNMLSKSIISSEVNCINVLRDYTDYFKDGHIYISNKNSTTQNSIKIKSEKIDIKIEDFTKHLTITKDTIEGIWNSSGYKVGIVKKENTYVAFIIEADTNYWKPNEIKFSIIEKDSLIYFMRDHSSEKSKYSIIDNSIIRIESVNAIFIKEFPKPLLSQNELKKKVDELEGLFVCKELSQKTMYLRLGNFNYPYVDKINQIIDENLLNITTHENLILDLRDNGGGTTDAYQKLLPILYTNPVRYFGASFLSTTTFINSLKKYYSGIDSTVNQKEKEDLKIFISLLENDIGLFVNSSNNNESVFEEKLDTIYINPKSIVILVNRNCASTAEDLLLKAKQSKKVKIMGTPTYGALDYGNQFEFDFGCNDYTLLLPTFRSSRLPDYPIDNIGIQPDIFLDRTVGDWIEYAKKYLEE